MSGGFFDYGAVLLDEPEGDYAQVSSAKIADLSRVLKNSTSTAAENKRIVTTGPALLVGFTASSTTAQFIQLFDSSTVPADNAIPLPAFAITAGGSVSIDWITPRYFANGIVICNSTSQLTKTLGAADTLFDVQYV